MRRRASLLTAIVPTVLACAGLLASVAFAAPSVSVLAGSQGARLTVAGKVIAIFRTTNGTLSPEDRAERAAERLRGLLRAGLDPGEIDVRSRGGSWAVFAGGGLLMIATPGEAGARHEDAETTARRWAANLKSALGGRAMRTARSRHPVRQAKRRPVRVPTLAAVTDSVALPVGQTRVVPLRGTARGPISVRIEGDPSASARVAPGKAAVEVRGLQPGKAVVRVGREGKEAGFAVWVKKFAGRVVETPTVEVTGVSAPASLVRRAAQQHVLECVHREPGTTVRVTGAPQAPRALPRGRSTVVSFPIEITGDSVFPVKALARVRVKNRPLESQEASVLLYSNDPESVRTCGTLFRGVVDTAAPARLFYHHQNKTGRAFIFQVHVLNPGSEPAEVQLVEADAGPFLDPIQVGHRAGMKYLPAAANDVGYIARIPGHGSRAVYTISVADELTVSGIYNLRVVTGGPVVVQIIAATELGRPEVSELLLDQARNDPRAFPSPQKNEQYSYACGERWTFMPLGRKAISGGSPDRKLFGNYGVLYNLTLKLTNPTDEVRTVRVVLAPEAGWARGAFLIDGKLVEAPQMAPPGETILWTVKLAPQEERSLRIQGMPLGGSFYPVSLVVRS